jgi:hypothetical protein
MAAMHSMSSVADKMREQSILIKALAALAVALVVYALVPLRRKGKLPPGPSYSVPWVGHFFQLADRNSVISSKFDRWAKDFGPIYSLKLFGDTIIVVSSYKVVKDLLEQRGAIYSGRKPLPMVDDFISSNANLAFIGHNEEWRSWRKATARELNINNVKQYRKIQERESYILAQGFIDNPQNLGKIAFRFAGSIAAGGQSQRTACQDLSPLVSYLRLSAVDPGR